MEEQKSMTAPQQQQGGAVAKKPQAKNLDTLKRVLNADSVMTQFKNALSKNASTFVASLIDLYSSDSKLQLCDPNQVVKEALKAAVLHLPINKALGQAFIIPYYNTVIDEKGNRVKKYEPVFQIGYKGLYQLAMRTGKYAIINADVVYEGELQRTCKLTGEIDVEGRKVSENVVGYFAYIQLVDGYHKALYMSVENMAAHAKRYSKAIAYNKGVTIDTLLNLAKLPVNADSTQVGWQGNFHAMAIKTVLRNLLGKYGYLTVSLQEGIASDTQGDTEDKPDVTVVAQSPEAFDDADVEYEDVTDVQSLPQGDEQDGQETEPDPGF